MNQKTGSHLFKLYPLILNYLLSLIFSQIISNLRIPKSTLSSFRNIDYSNLLGLNYSDSFKDLDIIKQFAKSFFKNWPIASIAYYCLNNNILSVSINSWYKYAKIFNIKRKNHQKEKYDIGIRASKPHNIWHADVTLFKTLDNLKAYIYLIVDNCSRYILDWKVSLKLSGEIRIKTIKKAYCKYIRNKKLKEQETSLIVDGGTENNCAIVEAVNKVLKYRFLFHNNISDITALEKHLDSFIPVYNNIRPHCGLNGLTPKQVLDGVKINKEKQRTKIKNAIRKRIAINTKYNCGLC